MLALSLTACGGGGSESSAAASAPANNNSVMTGSVVKAPVRGATIEGSAVDNAGLPDGVGYQSAGVTTDGEGAFTLPATPTGLTLFRAVGGEFFDESDTDLSDGQRKITLSGSDFLESVAINGQTNIAITPYTQALLEKTRREANGSFAGVLANNRASAITAFGFDPFVLQPANPAAPAGTSTVVQRQYALMLGGFAQVVNRISIQFGLSEPTFPVILAVIDDLSDGRLNGFAGNNEVFVDPDGAGPLGTSQLPSDINLNDEIVRFRNNNFASYGNTLITVDENALAVVGTLPNQAPTAVDDALGGAGLLEGGTLQITEVPLGVLANDSDPEGSQLDALIVDTATAGDLTLISDGTLTYIHNGDEVFTDTFTYRAREQGGDQLQSEVATVTITITPVNDAPTPVVNTADVEQGHVLNIDPALLTATDPEQPSASFTYTVATLPTKGRLFLNGVPLLAAGTFVQADLEAVPSLLTYHHDGSVPAPDSFTFTVDDGAGGTSATTTFNLNVTAFNPVAVKHFGGVDLRFDFENNTPSGTFVMSTALETVTISVPANPPNTIDLSITNPVQILSTRLSTSDLSNYNLSIDNFPGSSETIRFATNNLAQANALLNLEQEVEVANGFGRIIAPASERLLPIDLNSGLFLIDGDSEFEEGFGLFDGDNGGNADDIDPTQQNFRSGDAFFGISAEKSGAVNGIPDASDASLDGTFGTIIFGHYIDNPGNTGLTSQRVRAFPLSFDGAGTFSFPAFSESLLARAPGNPASNTQIAVSTVSEGAGSGPYAVDPDGGFNLFGGQVNGFIDPSADFLFLSSGETDDLVTPTNSSQEVIIGVRSPTVAPDLANRSFNLSQFEVFHDAGGQSEINRGHIDSTLTFNANGDMATLFTSGDLINRFADNQDFNFTDDPYTEMLTVDPPGVDGRIRLTGTIAGPPIENLVLEGYLSADGRTLVLGTLFTETDAGGNLLAAGVGLMVGAPSNGFDVDNQTPDISLIDRTAPVSGTIANGATQALAVTTNDPDTSAPAANVRWFATVGTFDNDSSTTPTWTAPTDGSGTARILVQADDGEASAVSFIDVPYGVLTPFVTPVSVDDSDNFQSGDSSEGYSSASGRFVLFESVANNLISGFNPAGTPHAFMRDMQAQPPGRIQLISGTTGNPANGSGADVADIIEGPPGSATALFLSNATNLGAADGKVHLYRRELNPEADPPVDNLDVVDSFGQQPSVTIGNENVTSAKLSENGQFAAFVSFATNLTNPPPSAGNSAIYRKELFSGNLLLVSADQNGDPLFSANFEVQDITPDGRFVLFSSGTDLLTAVDSNTNVDLYRKDMQTGELILVSAKSDGNATSAGAEVGRLNFDGSLALFDSISGEFVGTDTNGQIDVFLKDLSDDSLTFISSVDGSTPTAGGAVFDGAWSRDGRYAVLCTQDDALVGAATTSEQAVLRQIDVGGGPSSIPGDAFQLLSKTAAGLPGNNDSCAIDASYYGNQFFFESTATDLFGTGDNNSSADIYLAQHETFLANTVLDSDGDGLTDENEILLNTCPFCPDTDRDGLNDFEEVNRNGNPADVAGTDTDPNNPDSDGDEISDFVELRHLSDPLVAESNSLFVSPTGSDAAAGDSFATAIQTLDEVSVRLGTQGGGSAIPRYVMLEPGTYTSAMIFDASNSDTGCSGVFCQNVVFVGSVFADGGRPHFPPSTVFQGVSSPVVTNTDATLTFANILFTGGSNFDIGFGGGLRVNPEVAADTPSVIGIEVQISGNQSSQGGAGFFVGSGANLTLIDCLINNNRTDGIDVSPARGAGGFVHGRLTMEHCSVSGNSLTGGGDTRGAGLFLAPVDGALNDLADVSHSLILGNSIAVSGGLASGAGIAVADGANVPNIIFNNLIAGNAVSHGGSTPVGNNGGGGVGLDTNNDYSLISNSIIHNQFRFENLNTGTGGGLANFDAVGVHLIRDNIIWFNDDVQTTLPSDGDNISVVTSPDNDVTFNNIGDSTFTGTNDNIQSDPLLVGGAYLQQDATTSPSVDAGSSAASVLLNSPPFTTRLDGATDTTTLDQGYHADKAFFGPATGVSGETSITFSGFPEPADYQLFVGPEMRALKPGHTVSVCVAAANTTPQPSLVTVTGITRLSPHGNPGSLCESDSILATDVGDGQYRVFFSRTPSGTSTFDLLFFVDQQTQPLSIRVTVAPLG